VEGVGIDEIILPGVAGPYIQCLSWDTSLRVGGMGDGAVKVVVAIEGYETHENVVST